MLRCGGMSIWRWLFIVFGFWMIIILFVTMELSSSFFKDDRDRSSLDRIEMAEKTVSELKNRNQELQRMLSRILKTETNIPLEPSVATNGAGNVKVPHSIEIANELPVEANVPSRNLRPQSKVELPAPTAKLDGNNAMLLGLFEQYKGLYNQLLESWFYLRKKDEGQANSYDRYRNLLVYTEKFRDYIEPFKRSYANNISQILLQRIVQLQNPNDCSNAKIAICDIGKGCGFGCQIHHIAYCFLVAYATERSLYLNGKPWSYSIHGFNSMFHDVGTVGQCKDILSKPKVDWNGGSTDQSDVPVLKIPIVDSLRKKPDFMPMAIPEEFADQMKAFHSQPFVWWVGHFLRYILRPLPDTCNYLKEEINSRFKVDLDHFDEIKPLVGIQVRRTDKLLSEAQFHGVGEYLKWVEEYYDQLDYKLGYQVTRSVYIATDEPTVLEDASKLAILFEGGDVSTLELESSPGIKN